jgi:hypothetical protein
MVNGALAATAVPKLGSTEAGYPLALKKSFKNKRIYGYHGVNAIDEVRDKSIAKPILSNLPKI